MRGRTCSWAFAILSRETKFGPSFALCYSGVHNLTVCGEAYPAGGLDLPAVVVKSPSHDSLGSVLVGSLGIRRELVGGIIEIFVISPVMATTGRLDGGCDRPWLRERTYFADLDILVGLPSRGFQSFRFTSSLLRL
jgi:hypothetical protein